MNNALDRLMWACLILGIVGIAVCVFVPFFAFPGAMLAGSALISLLAISARNDDGVSLWRRLRPRFSVKTLFIGITLICIWLGYAKNWIRQRHDFIAAHDRRTHSWIAVEVDPDKWAPLGMSLLGEPCATSVQIVETDEGGLPRAEFTSDVQAAKKLFPEATIRILFEESLGKWNYKGLD